MIDPLHADRFAKVFIRMDWPERPAGEGDTGIDLVGIERDGGVCAIRCRFIRGEGKVTQLAIDSFLAAFSRTPSTARLIIATTDSWNSNVTNTPKDQQPPVTSTGLSDFLDSPIDW
ncbi:MAG: hypothetical protein M1557_02860 [Actinobacteria bacterium]|nr:hypothetical protein [Actinomycetota bacterium]